MGSLSDYNDAFDTIACKTDLPQDYLVEAYMEGLAKDYAGPVRLFKPRTLQEARSLARMQEITL